MMHVTKRVEFCAAHRYYHAEWTEEENRRRFGKAVGLHGHNYQLEVTVEGVPDPDTGMVMDLKALKDLITDAVLNDLDHRNLNEDVPDLNGQIPTPENLAVCIWERLTPRLVDCRLARVRLTEEAGYSVEFYGEYRP
ncbi:MAG TPA: 6-carboxytetrahydropterin synthase [Candidatus Baltobacteraceae bacterium]|nr:6-carboxytetrahydropterin synthase [Candidatus Baltobacteraceae bacterium]